MKLNFDDTMQALADERPIRSEQVRASVLRRKVWLVMNGAPGCLPDYHSVCQTRADALDTARQLFADDAPRGYMTALRRDGIAASDAQGHYRTEVCQVRVSDLF